MILMPCARLLLGVYVLEHASSKDLGELTKIKKRTNYIYNFYLNEL